MDGPVVSRNNREAFRHRGAMNRFIVTEICDDLGPQLDSICHKLVPHGPDLEDYRAEAKLIVLEAIQRHDPDRAPIVPFVLKQVRRKLIDRIDKDARRRRLLRRIHADLTQLPAPQFDLRKLLVEISEDAATAIRLALEEGQAYQGIRTAIRSKLRDLGWGPKRIHEAWLEIWEALS